MTHADLVSRAVRWLYSTRRCSVVFAERTSWGAMSETCDALGFKGADSIQVECKTSRADFWADQRKPHRHPAVADHGLGRERYYLTPKGLLTPEEIPEGWGLLEIRGRIVRVLRPSEGFGNHWQRLRAEISLLVSSLNPVSPDKVAPRPED